MNNQLPICTVGYLLRTNNGREEVLLSKKAATPKAIKRKIAGALIGYGGDVEPTDASIPQSFVRELGEESEFKANAENVLVMAKVLVKDEKGPRLYLYYLLVRRWSGQPGTNREMDGSDWYPTDPIPESVLAADKLVLPRIFKGEKLEGWVEYNADMNIVGYELTDVETIS